MLYGKTDALEFERKIVENLVEAGIQVCAAAGNSDKYALGGNALLSHPAYSIPGYPYNIPQTLTIASAQNPFSIQTALEAADGSLFVGLINSGFDSEELEGLSAEYAVIPGIGSAADLRGSTFPKNMRSCAEGRSPSKKNQRMPPMLGRQESSFTTI